jgi:malonyl-CoA O-methyltransferase
MPDPSPKRTRHIDEVAVQRALRRLASQATAPWLHQEVARRMAERLAIIKLQPERLVDWWSFTGAGAEVLAAAYPKSQRLEVEPTQELVNRSQQIHAKSWWSKLWSPPWRSAADGATVVLDGAFEASLTEPTQLVWANMMLHAVADPPALLNRWQRALSADGFVMFSCLGPDTLRELSALYRRLGWPAPTMNFVDMHDLGDMLVRAGFADPVMDQETLKLSWADAPALLAELKTMGSNASPDRMAGLRTPRWKAKLAAELAHLQGPDGRLYLSFEVAYGHAFKALPKAAPATQTEVSLDTMRSLVRAGGKGS